MRYNRRHFTWMSRKFQGTKMTRKYPFRKLKKRQRWEARGCSVKRCLLVGWRESKIPLRNEMSTCCPECQASSSTVGRRWLPGKQRARPLLPFLEPGGNELVGTMGPILLLSGGEDSSSTDCHCSITLTHCCSLGVIEFYFELPIL